MATMVDDIALTVIMDDGSTPPPPPPPPGITPALAELRQLMYEPGRGTWLSLRIIIDPPGSFVVHDNFDFDPLWDPPVPAVVYQRDLEAFPRSPEYLPQWYLDRMREPADPASPAEPEVPAPASTAPAEPERPSEVTGSGHDHVLNQLVGRLKHLLPPGWDYAQITHRAIGGHNETAAIVHSVTGRVSPWTPPESLSGPFHDLRKAAATPDAGTWLSARLEMRHPAAYRLTTSPDHPDFPTAPPRSAYTEELHTFPRTPENTPAWLRSPTKPA